MGTSGYVCARCGLAVYRFGRRGTRFWKHAAGGRSAPSCGKLPEPMPRVEHERQNRLQARVNAALGANPDQQLSG